MGKKYLKINFRAQPREWTKLIVFYLLLWQGALEELNPLFKYIDELVALQGAAILVYGILCWKKLKMDRSTARVIVCLAVFLTSGCFGNIAYRYQPAKYVLTDFYTNIKFYLSIVAGYYFLGNCRKNTKELLAKHARFCSIIFFTMLVLDQLFHIFPSPELRYGLRVSQLAHSHATYLAASMVFLISVLTVFYEKKNIPFIAMSLVVCCFTLRTKALTGSLIYILLVYFVLFKRKKLQLWHFLIMGVGVVWLAWNNLFYYYIELDGQSARSVLTHTSLKIMMDYFPIGTGFGTFGSAVAGEHYSPVYVLYDFTQVYELGGNEQGWGFFSDTFWPIIIGQTGIVGLVSYIVLLSILFLRILRIKTSNIYGYTAGLYAFSYIMISSTSEPAFNNSVSIPIAVMLGYLFSLENKCKNAQIDNN